MRASLARVPTYSQGLVAVNDNDEGKTHTLVGDDVAAKLLLMVGEMQGTVNGLREDIAEVKGAMETDRAAATASRRRIYEKLEDADKRTTKLESTVRVMGELVDKSGKDIAALAPTVEATAATVRNWTIRGGLVLGALAAVGGTLWWAITNYGVAAWRFFDQFIPK